MVTTEKHWPWTPKRTKTKYFRNSGLWNGKWVLRNHPITQVRKLRHREREVTSPPWVSSRSGPPALVYWLSVPISAHYTIVKTLIWKRPKKSPFWQWETESLTKVVIYPPYRLTQRQSRAPNSVSLISVNSIQFHKYCLCKCYVSGITLTAVVTSAYKHRATEMGGKNRQLTLIWHSD